MTELKPEVDNALENFIEVLVASIAMEAYFTVALRVSGEAVPVPAGVDPTGMAVRASILCEMWHEYRVSQLLGGTGCFSCWVIGKTKAAANFPEAQALA